MRMLSNLLAIAAVVSLAAPVAAAESPLLSLSPGTQVRVWVRGDAFAPRSAQVVRSGAEELQIFEPESGVRTISADAIDRLQWLAGRPRQTVKGALIGAGFGLAVALVGGAVGDCGDMTRGECIAYGMLLAVPGGAFTGGLAGTFVRRDDWRTLPLQPVRLSILPTRGGGVQARVAINW